MKFLCVSVYVCEYVYNLCVYKLFYVYMCLCISNLCMYMLVCVNLCVYMYMYVTRKGSPNSCVDVD